VAGGGAEPNISGNPGRPDDLGPRNPDDPVAGRQRRRQEIRKRGVVTRRLSVRRRGPIILDVDPELRVQ
jgi:hypothetical protein